jgi:hypothetical protein
MNRLRPLSPSGVRSLIACTLSIAILIDFARPTCSYGQKQEEIAASRAPDLPDSVNFNAHIRPIMSNTCFVCHGPDKEKSQSELRLDSFQAATEGGAIEPGKATDSRLYQRLIDKDDPMPPADFRHQLSAREIALFRKWIDQGAHYEQHWSFAPILRPETPRVSDVNVTHPIDMFIRSQLESRGLKSAEVADRRTLLRRLSLDLIGLPPTLEELNAFLTDDSPDAYQKQVDRLLASPHFGERMAAHWLDLVHFSDTVGFHGDQNQRVFAYRDYVIDSFNQNKPFDQFTLEQLAGDLLERPTDKQRVATALLRLNMMTREGGAQPGEYIAKYTADRVRILGTAWLGLTTGCCECHNHKYDPMTLKDFYSLGAFFDDLQQWGVYHDYEYTPNPDLRGFSNDHPFPPELRSPSRSLQQQIEFLEAEMAHSISSDLGEQTLSQPEFAQWVQAVKDMVRLNPDGWAVVSVSEAKASKAKFQPKILDDHSVLMQGKPVVDDVITLTAKLSQAMTIKTIRLDVLPDETNAGKVGRGRAGDFRLNFSLSSPADKPIEISLTQVDRLNPNGYANGSESAFLHGPWRSGPARWQLPSDESAHQHTAIFHLALPTKIGADQDLQFQITSSDVGRVRISVSPFSRFVSGQPTINQNQFEAITKQVARQPLSADEQAELISAYYLAITPDALLSPKVQTYRSLIAECRSGLAMTMVAVQAEPDKRLKTRVLPRGNWQDESGELVTPDTPDFLPKLPSEKGRRLTRLDLAQWLTSSENPLTARHFVNRTWRQFFGAGLSGKLDDLGNQGEWPSHPELLDWLADEFRSDWDVKKLVRKIVTSKTYQQRCATNSQNAEIDPFNRLLAFQSPRRLEAEIVRDNALAISGLLNKSWIGGPSIFPYQPANYYANLQFPDRGYTASPMALQYRRGVYVHWQRTFVHPSFLNFDAPARDECSADRPLSNSPQQALSLLNDPQFVETSLALAIRLQQEVPGESLADRIDRAFQLTLARSPTQVELAGLQALYQRQYEHYQQTETDLKALWRPFPFLSSQRNEKVNSDPASLAAWSQVCRVILNLHETITRY